MATWLLLPASHLHMCCYLQLLAKGTLLLTLLHLVPYAEHSLSLCRAWHPEKLPIQQYWQDKWNTQLRSQWGTSWVFSLGEHGLSSFRSRFSSPSKSGSSSESAGHFLRICWAIWENGTTLRNTHWNMHVELHLSVSCLVGAGNGFLTTEPSLWFLKHVSHLPINNLLEPLHMLLLKHCWH